MLRLEAVPDTADAAPDWSGPDAPDLACPLCGYNLRGLVEPRCPECGYAFAWRELLSPAFREHPYLFEHAKAHLRRSFWKTATAGLRPARFWTSIHPTQPSRVRRLLIYWFACAAVYLIGLGCVAFGWLWVLAREYDMPLTRMSAYEWLGWAWAVAWMLLPLAWPWLTLAALMVFRVSMRRARVKSAHVMRCVLYSFDGIFWIGALFIVFGTWGAWAGDARGWDRNLVPTTATALMLGTILMAVRLAVAYRLYLRFDRPVATVLTSQVIVGLLMLTVMLKLYGHRLVYSLIWMF